MKDEITQIPQSNDDSSIIQILNEYDQQRDRLETLVANFLDLIGEDVGREGLKDTPTRVASACFELFSGYHLDPIDVLGKPFEDKSSELIIVKDISMTSCCEHHLMPFYGVVHIGYVPNGYVVGISKLVRLVEVFARRLQIQERMCGQIADSLMEFLKPLGVMVVVDAQHTCMTSRGVKNKAKTMTSAIRGDFANNAELRAEFLALIKS